MVSVSFHRKRKLGNISNCLEIDEDINSEELNILFDEG